MSFTQELTSWMSPSKPATEVASPPKVGQPAPKTDKLSLPREQGKPTLITFLRHCGCPFAEKSFKDFRASAAKNANVQYIAVSHSDESSTQSWLKEVGGPGEDSSNPVEIIVDSERAIYSAFGLGTASWGHVLSVGGLYAVYDLGKKTGIWNRPTESGNRWQTSGNYAVDEDGIVRWGQVAKRADDIPDFEELIKAVNKK